MSTGRIIALQRRVRMLRQLIQGAAPGHRRTYLEADLAETQRIMAPPAPDASRLERFAASPSPSAARS